MVQWKETFEVQKETVTLGIAESGFSIIRFIQGIPTFKRYVIYLLLFGIVPATIGLRIGMQYYTESRLQSTLVAAHSSFVQPNDPVIGPVTVISVGTGVYGAYASFENENLDVVASDIPYQIEFYNASNQKVAAVSGKTYLLPNQKKLLVAPRVESQEAISSAKVVLGQFQWQKRFSLPEVDVKTGSPVVYESVDPLMLKAEGAVINNSPYRLGAVRLQFLVYDTSNRVIAVSQREEYDVPAFGRRAYTQSWPNIKSSNVSRVAVTVDTNVANGSNLTLEDIQPTDSDLGIPNSR